MKSKMFIGRVASIVLIFNLAIGQPSFADSQEDFDSWQNTLAPLYIWGLSMSGSLSVGPVTAPVDIEFSDAVSDLEGIFTFHYEGAKGHWGVILDYSYLNLSPTVTVPGTSAVLNPSLKNKIAEVAALYRFGADNPWELLGGIRSYNLDVTVGGLPSPPLPVSQLAIDQTFNDFFIGGRFRQSISDKWSFTGRADYGTGDSDSVWYLFASFDYRFTELLSGFVGWKVLDYDVDQGSGVSRVKYDMRHSGPLVALAFHW